MSPAAVSGAVRYLVQAGWSAGASRARATTTTGSTTTSGTRPTRTAARCCAAGSRAPAQGAEALGEEPAAGRRLRETAEFFAFLSEEMPGILERWHARPRGTSTAAG